LFTDEAVAEPSNRGDEPRLTRVVRQCAAQVADAAVQAVAPFDVAVAPELPAELRCRYQSASVPEQDREEPCRSGPEADRLPSTT
jgi:hypothetical protein